MTGVVEQVHTDVLVVGAGPAGSAAAIHAARAGRGVILADAARFPRDKTCGDGLTPRAMHQLRRLGLAGGVLSAYRNRGLKLHGFGGSVKVPWPDSRFGAEGSAVPRTLFDAALVRAAVDAGAELWGAARASAVERDAAGAVREVTFLHDGTERRVRCRHLIVADGVRSELGRRLGRRWHRGEVYGIAARSYCRSPRAREEWIHSHLELRDADGVVQPGYGWIFPLGDAPVGGDPDAAAARLRGGADAGAPDAGGSAAGWVNLGCGALSTAARPAKVNTKKLLSHYAAARREAWTLGEERHVTSAMLPMGGAVSGVAGSNWALIGDAAACVNPLNGEGIDYALETAEQVVALICAAGGDGGDLTAAWPALLDEHYGEAFLLARTLARALTHPRFLPAVGPLGLRGPAARVIMPAAARLMGNLVTDEDRDLVARVWRAAGAVTKAARAGSPLWAPADSAPAS
ncbi:FAD-dependent monooxygenase [Corynebacterium frankenforstense]